MIKKSSQSSPEVPPEKMELSVHIRTPKVPRSSLKNGTPSSVHIKELSNVP